MVKIINSADLTAEAIAKLSGDEAYWIYNSLDCLLTKEIRDVIHPMLDNVSGGTYSFSRDMQAPILEMGMRGVRVNKPRRLRVMVKFERHIHRLEAQLDDIVRNGIGAGDLNWRSPTQLGILLYDVMGLPEQKKRNTAGKMARTTDREALEKLGNYFIAEPVINHLLALRDLGKAVSFLETGIDNDGRIRTSFNIAGTNTGRLSSASGDYGTGTNLQNVARDLRSVFCADPGMKFANLDLEQADSRNLGALCWDNFVQELGERTAGAYLDACEGGDLHTAVCKMCNPHFQWGTQPDRAIADTVFYRDKTYRDGAKVLGHGSNYLGTPPTMASHTKFPLNLVRQFQKDYFGAFPVIPKYHDYVRYQLKHFASLTTLFGRRRFFYGRADDAATIREAVAYSPQSMTAEEINIGILNLWRSNRVQLLVQVHDSILFQYPEELENEIIPWALDALKAPLRLARGREFVVPTEAKVGWNWGDLGPDNPDGLIKWKGGDTRVRQETEMRLSIRGM